MRTETEVPVSDEDLVQQHLAGNGEAFSELVGRHSRLVYAIARARLRDADTADDLTQEVFLRAMLAVGHLRPPYRFAAWVSCIARNLAINWQRSGQRASRALPLVPLEEALHMPIDSGLSDVRESLAMDERRRAVHTALDTLPGDQRELVLLHFAEDMTQTEIAAALGINQATVSRRLQRACAALRGQLQPMLREAAPALRMPQQVMARSLALVGAAAGLSLPAKSSVAAALESSPALRTASLAKSGIGVGALLGTKPAATVVAVALALAAGGMILGSSTLGRGGDSLYQGVAHVQTAGTAQRFTLRSRVECAVDGNAPEISTRSSSVVLEPRRSGDVLELTLRESRTRTWLGTGDEPGEGAAEAPPSVHLGDTLRFTVSPNGHWVASGADPSLLREGPELLLALLMSSMMHAPSVGAFPIAELKPGFRVIEAHPGELHAEMVEPAKVTFPLPDGRVITMQLDAMTVLLHLDATSLPVHGDGEVRQSWTQISAPGDVDSPVATVMRFQFECTAEAGA